MTEGVRTRREKQSDLYKSWVEMTKLQRRMASAVLHICAHSEATEKDIMPAVKQYRELTQKLRNHQPTIVKALQGTPLAYHVERYSSFVPFKDVIS